MSTLLIVSDKVVIRDSYQETEVTCLGIDKGLYPADWNLINIRDGLGRQAG
jgi:hypothetical protein